METYSIITEGVLRAIMPAASAADIHDFCIPLNEAMKEFGITTPARQAAFLGQSAEESDQLWHQRGLYHTPRGEEYASGEHYEGRVDLGNTRPGYGVLYKGRDLLQTTGFLNYTITTKGIGVDLVSNPKALLDPVIGCRAACWHWKSHGLNDLADVNDDDHFAAITHRINGGLNGLDRRRAFWASAKSALAI